MNIIKNKLKELSFDELNEITGGGFFYDLGASAHRAFNRVERWLRNNDFGYYHSAG